MPPSLVIMRHTSKDALCNPQYVTVPYLYAVDNGGKAVHVRIPLDLTCLTPRPEVDAAMSDLDLS